MVMYGSGEEAGSGVYISWLINECVKLFYASLFGYALATGAGWSTVGRGGGL